MYSPVLKGYFFIKGELKTFQQMKYNKRIHDISDELFQYQEENISIIFLLSIVMLVNFFHLDELLYIDINI